MSKKIILISAGLLLTGAAVTTGVVFGVRAYNKSKQPQSDPSLNIEAKKVKADYENKNQTEVTKLDEKKIKFEGLDWNKYEARVFTVSPVQNENTSIEVTFGLVDKMKFTISDHTKIKITGFKAPTNTAPATMEELNKIINKIQKLKYKEDVKNIEVKDAKKESLIFEGLDAKYEAVIKSFGAKTNELSTVAVTFVIKEKNGNIESTSKVLELSGFKTASTNAPMNPGTTPVDPMNPGDSPMDPGTPGQPSLPPAVDPKKPTPQDEIAKILESITELKYEGNPQDTTVENIDKDQIKPSISLSASYGFRVIKVERKMEDISIAIVTFEVVKFNDTLKSQPKTLELGGFKKPPATKDELNEFLRNKVLVEFNKNKSDFEAKDVTRNELSFTILEKGYEISEVGLNAKDTDSTILEIKVKVKEKDGNVETDFIQFELNGFKKAVEVVPQPPTNPEPVDPVNPPANPDPMDPITPPTTPVDPVDPMIPVNPPAEPPVVVAKTKEQLDNEIDKITTAEFSGNKANTLAKDVRPDDISFPTLGAEYEVVATQVSVRIGKPASVFVTFAIKEKGGSIESKFKTIEIPGFKSVAKTQSDLDEIANRIMVIFNADKTTIDLTKTVIDGNWIGYRGHGTGIQIINEKFTVKPTDPTVLLVTFNTKENNGTILSNPRTVEISGFKKPAKTETELNSELLKINVEFDGNKVTTVLTDAANTPVKFTNLSAGIETTKVTKTIKSSDSTVLIVSFRVKEVGGTLESNVKTIEISGFKKPSKSQEELNKELAKVRVDFVGDKANTTLTNLNDINLRFTGFGSEFEIIGTTKTVKPNDPTTLLVSFKIREKANRSIESATKTIEISGFKRPAKSIDELNKDLAKVTAVYNGNPATTVLTNPNDIIIRFVGLTSGLEVTGVTKTIKQGDPTILVVTFKVKEIGGRIESAVRTVEFKGFKKPGKTLDELNKELAKVSAVFDGDKSRTTLSNPTTINVRFTGLGADFELSSLSKTVKQNDPTTLVVTFRIREKGTRNLESSSKTVEITGFRRPAKTQDELNREISRVTATFNGNPATTVITNPNNVNIRFIGLGSGFEISGVMRTIKQGDPTTLVVTFKIREVGGTIESSAKTVEIKGFKKPGKSQAELDVELAKVSGVFDGDKSKTTLLEPDKVIIRFVGLGNGLEASSVRKTVKGNDLTTLLITFKIREIGGSVESSSKTVEISGFARPARTKEQLNNEIQKVNAVFNGIPSKTRLTNPNDIMISFTGLTSGIEITGLTKRIKRNDPTTLEIMFKVKERNGSIESDWKNVEIKGFLPGDQTSPQLDVILNAINVSYDDNYKKYTLVHEYKKEHLKFSLLDNRYETIIEKFVADNRDQTLGVLTFRIKEKGKTLTSSQRTVTIRGFRRFIRISSSYDRLASSVRADYKDKNRVLLRNSDDLKNLPTSQVRFSNFDSRRYWVTVKDMTVTRSGTLTITIYIVDKRSGLQSNVKTLYISGFRTR